MIKHKINKILRIFGPLGISEYAFIVKANIVYCCSKRNYDFKFRNNILMIAMGLFRSFGGSDWVNGELKIGVETRVSTPVG